MIFDKRINSRTLVSSLLLASLMLLGVFAILPLDTAHAQSAGVSGVEVSTANNSGGHIYGYYVTLWENGQVIDSCFSSCGFTIDNGVQYQIAASNYGSWCFAFWALDTGPSYSHFATIYVPSGSGSAELRYAAEYQPCNGNSATTSQLTITSQDTSGTSIHGYYTILYNSAGSTVATGFTPKTFTLNNGASYSVQVDNYGSCNFAYWLDNQSLTTNYRTVDISSNTQYTAVYNCGGSSSGSGTFTINVNSVDQNGIAITGYYIVLYYASGPYFTQGSVAATGFTSTSFTGNQGQEYLLQADSYGSCTFSNWSVNAPGSGGDIGVAYTGSSSQTWTAVYSCS